MTVADDEVVRFGVGGGFERGVVGGSCDLAQGLARDGLCGFRVRAQRNVIDVGGKSDFFAAGSDYVAGEAFPVQHYVGVEAIFGAESSGFCEDVPGAWIGGLNFCERAVFAKNRQRFEEDRVVGASGPIGEVLANEIGAEEVSPVAASAIALGDAGEIELGVLQEGALGGEAGLQRIFTIFCDERAKEIGAHA